MVHPFYPYSTHGAQKWSFTRPLFFKKIWQNFVIIETQVVELSTVHCFEHSRKCLMAINLTNLHKFSYEWSIISGTLVSIVQGLGSITESLAPFLHDVIYMSTFLDNSCSVYLLEDGLELWLVALQNSKHLLPQWMQLGELNT